MIGEMRDSETAAVGVSAALAGQTVFATVHSNDAPRTIDRLIELGVERHSLAAALTAVVAQRLVRKLCTACANPNPFRRTCVPRSHRRSQNGSSRRPATCATEPDIPAVPASSSTGSRRRNPGIHRVRRFERHAGAHRRGTRHRSLLCRRRRQNRRRHHQFHRDRTRRRWWVR